MYVRTAVDLGGSALFPSHRKIRDVAELTRP